MNNEEIVELIKKLTSECVGDTPVPIQITEALMDHTHNNYPTREEYEKLKAEVERLSNLVGDTSVVEQISAALNG